MWVKELLVKESCIGYSIQQEFLHPGQWKTRVVIMISKNNSFSIATFNRFRTVYHKKESWDSLFNVCIPPFNSLGHHQVNNNMNYIEETTRTDTYRYTQRIYFQLEMLFLHLPVQRDYLNFNGFFSSCLVTLRI